MVLIGKHLKLNIIKWNEKRKRVSVKTQYKLSGQTSLTVPYTKSVIEDGIERDKEMVPELKTQSSITATLNDSISTITTITTIVNTCNNNTILIKSPLYSRNSMEPSRLDYTSEIAIRTSNHVHNWNKNF